MSTGSKVAELKQKLLNLFKREPTIPQTVLFAPLDSLGHINSLVYIANVLRSQGHRTVFLFLEPIENNLKENGHEVYDSTTADLVEMVQSNSAQDKWNEVIKMCQPVWREAEVIKCTDFELDIGFGTMIDDIKKYNDNVAAKLELIKPDVLVIDHYFAIPALFKINKPWVRIFSASPLGLHDKPDTLPPRWSGLPTKFDPNNEHHKMIKDKFYDGFKRVYDQYNEYWTSHGLPALPLKPLSYIPVSPLLNLYMYPKELDYNEHPLPDWVRCDSMVRDPKASPMEVPAQLRDKPGKLIFLSLGSLAAADLILMQRLVDILKDSPHRFIVNKGPFGDQLQLGDNMWGANFLPQLQLLQIIDLIITHGGNNTITESFFYAVPGFIVCPLFGDQLDNAQRIEEMGLGVRVQPYKCTKEEMLSAIESVLNKADIRDRMKAISRRMQKSSSRTKAADVIVKAVNTVSRQQSS